MLNFASKKYTISAKTEVAPSTFLFRLRGNLKFMPGQIVEISSDHFGEATFAPCSSPSNEKYFEICIRNCGSTSHHLADLMPGDEMSVRGPYGIGWPIEKLRGKEIVMIAGGLGLVPLRPLISSMLEKNQKNIAVVAGFRSSEHLLFENDLKSWSKIFKVHAMTEVATERFWGEKGLITDGIEKLKLNHKKTVALICGPEVMVPFCIEELAKKGIQDNQIFISYERRMECGIGICQHCSIGKYLVCKDGPVFAYDKIKGEIGK
ncbi:MAG: FAD/NAD(P)-binding protein [Patescibacteria group bacterium]|jgi:NAD(P)H-flavin reductase